MGGLRVSMGWVRKVLRSTYEMDMVPFKPNWHVMVTGALFGNYYCIYFELKLIVHADKG